MEISTIGALLGLVIAIVLIIKKVAPAYSLIFGALLGGLIGGASLSDTVATMVTGAQSITPSVLRIITAGVLAGVLIKSRAAETIAEQTVIVLGEKRALASLAIATMLLCAVGVFIDVAVITVAPIALAISKRIGYTKPTVLLAMIGGGKAGNIISPNPNTIALSENYGVDLSRLMAANIVPAICALIMTIILCNYLAKKSGVVINTENTSNQPKELSEGLPNFWAAMSAPIIVVVLLSLRNLIGFAIDPLVALPVGALCGAVIMGKAKDIREYTSFGLQKMMPVAVLLIGTGTISGIIKASNLQVDTVALLNLMNIPTVFLPAISGILMAGATASTTAGSTIASSTFSGVILEAGITPLAAAAMTHCGATVIDSLPHGSFFHATAGATEVTTTERMKLIPYEAIVGLTSTVVSVIIWGFIM